MSPKRKFHVFLSHNSKDKPWVIKLKTSLEKEGIKVWLDKDEIRPGDLFAKALEKGIEESRAVALIISPESMSSGWVENEYYRALSLATNGQLQLIPVLYKDAQIPGFLKDRNWVDFSNESEYDEKLEILIWGITGKRTTKDDTDKIVNTSDKTNLDEHTKFGTGIQSILFKIEHSSYNPELSDEQKTFLKNLFAQAEEPKPIGEIPMNMSEINEVQAADVFDQTSKSVAYFLSSLAVHHSKWPRLILADTTTEQSMKMLEAIEDQVLLVSGLVEKFSDPENFSIYQYETQNVLRSIGQLQALLDDINNYLISGNIPSDISLQIERLFDDLVFYAARYLIIVNDLAQLIKRQKPLLQ
jgi:hypothetical protein